MIVPAQFDLLTDLGISGQFDHPDFLAAFAKVEAAAKQAGIPLGNVGMSKPPADAQFERGTRDPATQRLEGLHVGPLRPLAKLRAKSRPLPSSR